MLVCLCPHKQIYISLGLSDVYRVTIWEEEKHKFVGGVVVAAVAAVAYFFRLLQTFLFGAVSAIKNHKQK